ncbi:MAG: glycosyltransferase [Akkermansiaceae bacterium]|nr:glycosyltransferase [Akkermansiaceae bacterium]
MSQDLLPQIAPCFVTHNMALGGAQTAVLRYIQTLPAWVRERTTLYCQSDDMPLLEKAVAAGFDCGEITRQAPGNPSSWFLSYGDLAGLPERPTSLVLHSWDDAGWRYFNKAYAGRRGMTVAGVSQKVMDRYRPWIRENGHTAAGILPPPVTEFCMAKGNLDPHGRIVVGWMGRPLEDKGLMSLPHLLKENPRLVVRAWTGAETAGLEYTQKVQGEAMAQVCKLAAKLGVADRLDIRPLDFNPISYRHRLEGCHVLLGNSRKEGFLLTAAEALSCGIPVVVTKTCGIADFIKNGQNGYLIDWNDNPKRLAKAAHRAILKAAKLDPVKCLASAEPLSLGGNYARAFRPVLGRLTHTALQHDDARVTFGLRIHQGVPEEYLDDAVNSIASQTYRKFKVVLLVDGPWEFGERLAERYGLPLICTGQKPDIEHCSWLHRQAVAQCDTEFYKPLDYDDQLLPNYLERAVSTLEARGADVYGCLLNTLQDGEVTPRLHWPNKPVESMFTGNSDDNMLPHSSVLMRTRIALKAGNYQERAIGLGADDYHLWFRIFKAGGEFFRDDDVRNVVYRIHDKNSLNIRRARFGHSNKRKQQLLAGAAAAGIALATAACDSEDPGPDAQVEQVAPADQGDRLDPPHS